MWNHIETTSSTQLCITETMLGGAGSRDAGDPRELRLPHLQDDRIQLAFPPKAQVDDQQGSDSAIPNYLFFFLLLILWLS